VLPVGTSDDVEPGAAIRVPVDPQRAGSAIPRHDRVPPALSRPPLTAGIATVDGIMPVGNWPPIRSCTICGAPL
jgi:hypothetical protein